MLRPSRIRYAGDGHADQPCETSWARRLAGLSLPFHHQARWYMAYSSEARLPGDEPNAISAIFAALPAISGIAGMQQQKCWRLCFCNCSGAQKMEGLWTRFRSSQISSVTASSCIATCWMTVMVHGGSSCLACKITMQGLRAMIPPVTSRVLTQMPLNSCALSGDRMCMQLHSNHQAAC